MSKNPIVKEILEKYQQVWALQHSMAVLGWDGETHMPEGGARSRGMAGGQLAMMIQKHTLDMKGLVDKAAKAKDLDDFEKGVVRVAERNMEYYVKVPPKLVNELQKVTTEATVAWRTARKNSDYKAFKPHLEKIIALKIEEAEKLGYQGSPYNAHLDLYEEGFTVEDADAVYSKLVPGTRKILAKIEAAGVFPSKHPLEDVKYKTPDLEKVNEGLVEILQMPKDTFRMDISTHPFTTSIAPDDVRITTRYEGSNFKASTFATIHECGHAIYGLGIGKELRYTPLGDGASYGVHESQSRFWENVVGRSMEFTKLVMPLLKKNLPFVKKYDAKGLYLYFNIIRKSLVRVEADEVTYNMHTAVRYEVEKKMLSGKAKAAELPEVWNDTFDSYLGITPPNDAKGILQDVHWSGGSIGYFPTYTLGNVITGMIWHKMKDGETTRAAVAKGDIGSLKTWLGKNIHQYGSMYAPKVLQERVFGEAYNPQRLLSYFEHKYLG